MTVAQLIEVLKRCDPDLPVATHALNHTFAPYDAVHDVRVFEMQKGGRLWALVGAPTKKNYGNEVITRPLDDGPDIPDEWPRY